MPNPFNVAQDQAQYDPSTADPGAAPVGAPGSAGSFQTQGVDVSPPSRFRGSLGEIGQVRDALMAQFPEVNTIGGEQPFSIPEKLGLLAYAISNPQGALDLVRSRKQEAARKRAMAAQLNLQMLGVASRIVDSQNEMERSIFDARLKIADAKRQDARLDLERENKDAQRSLFEAQTELAGVKARNAERAGAFAGSILGSDSPFGFEGGATTDQFGNPISAPPSAAPGPTLGDVGGGSFQPTVTLGSEGVSAKFSPKSTKDRVFAEKAARARGLPPGSADPQLAGFDDDTLDQILFTPAQSFLVMGGEGSPTGQ